MLDNGDNSMSCPTTSFPSPGFKRSVGSGTQCISVFRHIVHNTWFNALRIASVDRHGIRLIRDVNQHGWATGDGMDESSETI